MNRLYNLVVAEFPCVQDMLFARELAISVAAAEEKPKGLPSHMWDSAKECAYSFLDEGEWYYHLFLCLLLVQARAPHMENAEIFARLELERLLMNSLFGMES